MAKLKNLQMELRADEDMLWTGCPCENKEYGKIDRVLLPVFALLLAICTFYAVLVVFSILRFGFSINQAFQIVLLLLAGGYAVYGYFFRFAAKRGAKQGVAYGVTSSGRVLIRDGATNRVRSIEGAQLRKAYVSERGRYGYGTIYLGRKRFGNLFDNTGLDFWGGGIGAQAALFDIPECDKVLKLIKGTR